MTCRNAEKAAACFTKADGTKISGFVHTIYGDDDAGNHIVEKTVNTDAQDNPIAAADIKSVSSGACPIPEPVWQKMCDNHDGVITQFWCVVTSSFNAEGGLENTVQNFAMDKIKPYEPSGEVGECEGCPPVTAQGIVDTWGGGKK